MGGTFFARDALDMPTYFGLVGLGSKVTLPIDHQTLANITNCGFAPGVDHFGNQFYYNQASTIPQMFNDPANVPALTTYALCSFDHTEGVVSTLQGSQLSVAPFTVTPTGVQFDMSLMSAGQKSTVRLSTPGSASYSLEYAYRVPGNINHVFTQTFDLVAPCSPVASFTGYYISDTQILLSWPVAKVKIEKTVDGGANWSPVVNNFVGNSYVDVVALGSPIPTYRIFSICTASSIDYISIDADLTILFGYLGGKDPFRHPRMKR